MNYTPSAKYTPEELDRLALLDLETDLKCAIRDGLPEYAAELRAMIEKHKNGGAHKAVLNSFGEAL